jgi:hypothetical protein
MAIHHDSRVSSWKSVRYLFDNEGGGRERVGEREAERRSDEDGDRERDGDGDRDGDRDRDSASADHGSICVEPQPTIIVVLLEY